MKREYSWADGKSLSIGGPTLVMGILNVTPDSFSDGGQWYDPAAAVAHLREMEEDGADLVDVGAESSRPGFVPVSAEEEIERLQRFLPDLVKAARVPLSVDSFKAKTISWALEHGANIINDIWGLQRDSEMVWVAAAYQVPVIIMHNHEDSVYQEDILTEMEHFFVHSIELALAAGVEEKLLILDPGIGFGKTPEQNMEVLRRLPELMDRLPYPWLLATSRKGFIGKALGLPVTERMEGTAATCLYGQLAGCHMVRVHDVKPIARMVKMTDIIMGRRGWTD